MMMTVASVSANLAAAHNALPVITLARHGETAWSMSGQNTGLADIALTERGEREAALFGKRLKGLSFSLVLTSPLQRARRTCEIAGFDAAALVDRDLVEWDYGQYEGLRLPEIVAARPDWKLFRDGCPGGELPEQVIERADRVVNKLRAASGDALVFSSGHILRVIAARWLGVEPVAISGFLALGTASVSALGYESELSRPVIRLWNDRGHVEER